MKYLINYNEFINEAANISPNVRKVLRAIYWLNINKGFYGELISSINVYISTKPKYKTMCTDCYSFIACHPEFVAAQSEPVIRAILIHEILHVIGQHHQRRGGRDQDLWNEACDYAINPIIKSDVDFGKDIDFPKIPEGAKEEYGLSHDYNVLFEERFVGMRAEDIYDIMISEGRKPGTGTALDKMTGPIQPGEVGETVQRKNNNDDIEKEVDTTIEAGDDVEQEKEVGEAGDENKDKLAPGLTKKTKEGGIADETSGSFRVKRNALKGDLLKGSAEEHTGDTKKIYTKDPVDWERLKEKALSRNAGSLKEETRRLLRSSLGNVPIVNWKAELKKFFDHNLTGRTTILPNKRLLASGNILFGSKKTGISTLKTIVAAVDTSGSISEDQQKTFINEVMYLCKKYQADKTIIIYCSDDIDGVDIVKKGEAPDFSKMKTTGGNSKGFIPPFQWVEKNHIKPSVFIYLTDTGGAMPDKYKYGIGKYVNKVIWFICSASMYNTPPFGKILYMPVNAIKPSKTT